MIKIDIYTDNVNSVQRVYLSRLTKDFLIGGKLNFQPTQQLTIIKNIGRITESKVKEAEDS